MDKNNDFHQGSSQGAKYPELFETSAQLVRDKLGEFAPTSLANISWAFAKHGQGSDKCTLLVVLLCLGQHAQGWRNYNLEIGRPPGLREAKSQNAEIGAPARAAAQLAKNLIYTYIHIYIYMVSANHYKSYGTYYIFVFTYIYIYIL